MRETFQLLRFLQDIMLGFAAIGQYLIKPLLVARLYNTYRFLKHDIIHGFI